MFHPLLLLKEGLLRKGQKGLVKVWVVPLLLLKLGLHKKLFEVLLLVFSAAGALKKGAMNFFCRP